MSTETHSTEPPALSISATASRLGVARSTPYRLRNNGELGYSRIAGKPVVLRSELERYLATLAAQAAAERGAVP